MPSTPLTAKPACAQALASCAKAAATALAVLFCAGAHADDVGYQDLITRLGATAPTGAGVAIVQTEGTGVSTYIADAALPDFAGKNFVLMSGPSTPSSHATEVGRNFYGTVLGMAHGVQDIYAYEAINWVQAGYLRLGAGAVGTPLTPPGNARVFNNSWIGNFGTNALDNETLRRADFAMQRDFTLMISAENNGAGGAPPHLLSMNYNGISVGLTSGAHSAGVVPAGIDGAGRQVPLIVAPGGATSFSTPVVSAAAALLYETGNLPPLNTDVWARRGLVIKAALLAGAKHRDGWTNNTPQSGADRGVALHPLDTLWGVDTVNIDRSHRILTAGRTLAIDVLKLAEVGGNAGWEQYQWPVNSANTAVYVRFSLATTDNTASFVCTWNRTPSTQQLSGSANAPTVANLDMTLFKLENDQTTAITGPAGESVFSSGNCASRSAADNVEHLFLRGLKAGDYVLEVRRMDAGLVIAPTCVAWFIDAGPLPGDLNGDHLVDGADLGILLSSWGLPGTGDLNGDGTTDGADLGILLSAWTPLGF